MFWDTNLKNLIIMFYETKTAKINKFQVLHCMLFEVLRNFEFFDFGS